METTRLSTKGQVILPKAIREARSLKPGTEFSVEATAEGILLRPFTQFPPTKLEDVFASLRYEGKPKTLAQMRAGIEKEVKRRHDRSRH